MTAISSLIGVTVNKLSSTVLTSLVFHSAGYTFNVDIGRQEGLVLTGARDCMVHLQGPLDMDQQLSMQTLC